jgi:hypothetical protein
MRTAGLLYVEHVERGRADRQAQHTNIPIDCLLLSSYTESSASFVHQKAPPLVHYIAVEHKLKAIVLWVEVTGELTM